jgi:hypothetical protein
MPLTIDQVQTGQIIYTDNGFTCLSEGPHTVYEDEGGRKYIGCEEGRHYLDGQLDFEDGTTLVGLSDQPFK